MDRRTSKHLRDLRLTHRLLRLAALGLICCGSLAHAGGFSVTQFGSRRTGMLANMGAPDEATALYHNPAGLADHKGWRVHLSSSMAFVGTHFRLRSLDTEQFPELACTDADCRWPVGDDDFYVDEIKPLSTMGFLPYVGVSRDLGPLSKRLKDVTVSMAVTAPNVYAGTLPAEGPSSYFFVEGYFVVLSTIFGAGWRINDQIAVGGNVMYNYMRLRYKQRYALSQVLRGADGSGAAMADLAQALIGDIGMDYRGEDHGFGYTVSLLYTPTRWLAFGLAYNDGTDARFRGPVSISPTGDKLNQQQFNELVTGLNYRLPSELIVEMPIPPFISMGTNVKPLSWLELGFDARLWIYNVYEEQVMDPIYDTDVGTAPLTRESLSRKKDYGLSYDLSFGVLVRPLPTLPQLELMAGGGFDKSPVPKESLTMDNPALDNWRVACGVRWHGERGLRVALTYIYMGYLRREVTESKASPPLNGVASGSNQTPRLELEYIF